FARGLSQPTAMAYGPDGRIYVTQTGGSLVAIRPGTRRAARPGGGVGTARGSLLFRRPTRGGSLAAPPPAPRRPAVLVRGLRTPLGLAWRGRDVFVSEQGRLERFTLRRGRLPGRRVSVKGLPFGEHQQANVVFHNRRLWWGSGSTCDACTE